MKHPVIKNFIAVLLFFFIYLQSHACTIFTLVSQGIVLFCSNEDFNNPVTGMSRNTGGTKYDYVMIFNNMRFFAGFGLDNEDKLSRLYIPVVH